MIRSKRYKNNIDKIDSLKEYSVSEAISLLDSLSKPKLDETVELAVNLGVDPRHADQAIRGTVSLPNGTGKDVRVLVFAKGDNVDAAEKAGADFVGSDELIAKFKSGWSDIDVVVATPDMMAEVGKLGKVLGPKGLMPSPKAGTVTNDVAKAVREIKSGKIEFRVDKNGIIHAGIGKLSFDNIKLEENIRAFMGAIMSAKPNSLKGTYLKKLTVTSTMGPGIKINQADIAVS